MGVSVECIDVDYSIGKVHILRNISLRIPAGQFLGIVGPSGAGKTSLLRVLAGLTGLSGGSIHFYDSNGQLMRVAQNTVALLFQSLALWPHVTVRGHAELALSSAMGGHNAEEVLAECGICKSLWTRYPHQLSGGELQRVALARALASQPMLLLVDEPLVSIDQALRTQIQSLLETIRIKYGTTIVYVTHQWEEIANLCENIVVLDQGCVVQQGPIDRVYWQPVNRRCATVTGQVMNVSAAWLKEGRIGVEDESVETSVRLLGGVRPQQIEFIEPRGSNSWSVSSIQPMEFGWRCQLRSDQEIITLNSSKLLCVGDIVGLVIRTIPTAPA